MKYFILSCGLLLLLACQQGKQELPTAQTSLQSVSKEDSLLLRYLKEVQWPKAYREQDTVLLDKILGDDFQMIDASGNWSDKVGELEWIKANAMQHDSFFYEIKRLDVLPNGTALICGTGHIMNDTVKTIYQSSNILIKRDGIWKAVASHVSGIKKVE
ncbi:nuclear transport factor 2 family protein [Allomuricauda sp. SCSIO 65647]|uniref:nuclear transport factor 2 family protein n=1 Tax=Allomuricauda sp. SCSIO 65647 TaxID=2908843 RepID=UPI001F429749|nr:nuclear transport factor 2 family protein [Muricauda sp. SCSIO 65647]UJH68926.1 nuclear transport factor 2 family protein [Muricauda sp. SCSIO 65647]